MAVIGKKMKTSTFLALIAIAGGLFHNRDKINHWLNPPPAIAYVSGQREVVLYSTTWCGYCAKTRKYFAENNIQFTDLDVEHSEKGRSDYEQLGHNGVPIVVINNGEPIHGYNPKAIAEALAKTGDP